jgi:hypothetical protein
MAVHLRIEFDELVELVEQLPPEQQQALIARVLRQRADQRPLTVEEKLRLLDAAKLDNAVLQEPSIRREDWYGDDGR